MSGYPWEDFPKEAQKQAYLSRTKEKLMKPVMNAVDLLVREQLKPESITDEEAIELFGIQEAIEEHQASGKSHPYKSFSEFVNQGGE